MTGAALGAGLAMLLAAKAATELRNQLSDQTGALAKQAREGDRKVTDRQAHLPPEEYALPLSSSSEASTRNRTGAGDTRA